MDSRKDAVLTGLEIVIYAGIAWTVWKALITDDKRTLVRLRLAKSGEAYCQRKAESWAHLADACRKTYDQSRSVTV